MSSCAELESKISSGLSTVNRSITFSLVGNLGAVSVSEVLDFSAIDNFELLKLLLNSTGLLITGVLRRLRKDLQVSAVGKGKLFVQKKF